MKGGLIVQMEQPFKLMLWLVCAILLCPLSAWSGQYRVSKVYDGETLRVERYGISVRVRLAAIHAAQRQAKNKKSDDTDGPGPGAYLNRRVGNRFVNIESLGVDAENRLLGLVYLDGENINLEMVRAGLARVDPKQAPENLDLAPFYRAEKEAACRQGLQQGQERKARFQDRNEKKRRAEAAGAMILYLLSGNRTHIMGR
jgi:endonuclease YncB( thermonuclease family)